METRENTLSERERILLNSLLNDPDETARRRARVLLDWAEGQAPKAIAKQHSIRTAQVNKLARTFLQNRIQVFPPAAVERALRGAAGTTTVEELADQHVLNRKHTEHVTRLALQLFDATQSIHQIPSAWRRLLVVGAQLHNLGAHAEDDPQHQHTAHDVILAHDLEGYTTHERDVLACLVLFHRKRIKPEKDALFVAFDEETKHLTLALAAILRVADGLDFTKSGTTSINSINCNSVVDVVIRGAGAVKNAARANKKADVWRQVLAPPLVVRVDPARVGSFSPDGENAPDTKTAPDSQTSMNRAGRQIIGIQFEKLESYDEPIRATENQDAVHDMRVACRRINSAIRLFRPYLPAKRVKKLRPFLEELRDTLGAARNLDVLAANLEDYRESATEQERDSLQGVAAAWRDERAELQHDLVKLLDGGDLQDFAKQLTALVATVERNVTPRVADVVPTLIWKQYGKVRAYETRLATATLEELHALRIDIKRLRYTLEFFRDPLSRSDDSGASDESAQDANSQASRDDKLTLLIEPLIALQDLLGVIQDAVVAGEALTDFIAAQARKAKDAGETLPEFQAIAAYHAHLQSRIAALRAQLPDHWEVILRPDYRQALASAAAAL